MKNLIKMISFDVTNTLLQFKIPPWEKYAEIAKKYGYKGKGQDIKDKYLESLKTMMKTHSNFGRNDISWENWWWKVAHMTFDGLIPKSSIDLVAKDLLQEYSTDRCYTITRGGIDLIKMLARHKFGLGVISNSDPRLNLLLKNMKLYDYFDFVVTSYVTGFMKPNPKIFTYAFNEAKQTYDTNLLTHQCLHIGDDFEKDYKGARSAGWHSIILQSDTKKAIAQGIPKEHVFQSLEDLQGAIENNSVYL